MKETAPFQFDVMLDTKAVVSEEDGDLLIEGYASDYREDRDGEAFEPGCFQKSLQKYLDTNPVLLYHHKTSQALGQVLSARLDPNGLWVKARIDKPAPGSWAQDVFQKVKRGTIRGFSVGGQFKRRFTEKGWKIHDADIVEISVTPTPVNPRTLHAVATKAFDDNSDYDELVDKLDRTLTLLSQATVT